MIADETTLSSFIFSTEKLLFPRSLIVMWFHKLAGSTEAARSSEEKMAFRIFLIVFFCGYPSKRKKIDSFAFFITRIFSTFTHLSGFLEIILWGIEIESTKSISKEQWKGIYIILKEYCNGLELRLQSMSTEYWNESKDKTDQIHFDIEKNRKVKQIKYIPLLKRFKR